MVLLAVQENSVLPMGSHATLKVTSVGFKRYFRAERETSNDVRSWPSYNINCKKIRKKMRFIQK